MKRQQSMISYGKFFEKTIICVFCLLCLLFVSACKERTALLKGNWQLVETRDNGSSRFIDSSLFSLEIGEGSRVSGRVACNHWHGTGIFDGKGLYVSSIGVTKKRCHFDDNYVKSVAERYLEVLSRPSDFSVRNDTLQINVSSDEVWLFLRDNTVTP